MEEKVFESSDLYKLLNFPGNKEKNCQIFIFHSFTVKELR